MTRPLQTLVAAAAALAVALVGGAIVRWRVKGRFDRYNARSAVRYSAGVAFVLAVLVIWKAFSGRSAVVVGLVAGGLAFAMQEVVGAVGGWFNILSGRIYRVGDRIEIAGVQGDVIDITPLRTKIMEIGSAREVASSSSGDESAAPSWVKGRQTTGRLVAISNKATFEGPVFNYSASFDYVWEELTVPVPYRDDWRSAERILLEEARNSSAGDAEAAMETMARQFPLARVDVQPEVFVQATDNWVELTARFIVPVRSARQTKAEMTRRVLARFEEAGITVASETVDATLFQGGDAG